jgi:hypothetical protein
MNRLLTSSRQSLTLLRSCPTQKPAVFGHHGQLDPRLLFLGDLTWLICERRQILLVLLEVSKSLATLVQIVNVSIQVALLFEPVQLGDHVLFDLSLVSLDHQEQQIDHEFMRELG